MSVKKFSIAALMVISVSSLSLAATADRDESNFLPAIFSLLMDEDELAFPANVIFKLPHDGSIDLVSGEGFSFWFKPDNLELDSTRFNYEILSGPANVSISLNGRLQVLSTDLIGRNSVVIRITDLETGAYRDIAFDINTANSEVVAEAFFGVEGGLLSNEWQDVVLTIPVGALQEETLVKIIKSYNDEGDVVYSIDSSGPILKLLELSVPKQVPPFGAKLKEGFFYSEKNNAIRKSDIQEISWRSWPAEYGRVKAIFDDPVNRFRNGIDTSLLIHPNLKVEQKVDASTLYSYCGSIEDYNSNCNGREPVLLVHGYSPLAENDRGFLFFPSGQGGGDATWGNLPELIQDNSYSVFEFRWRTNSSFVDTADDLGKAIALISKVSGKRVHIVAHSFGGLLSRTYLQNYARTLNYGGNVQSLLTIGTPHSGIFQESRNSNGRNFPAGQDNMNLFRACQQSSCNQAGQPTPDIYQVLSEIPAPCTGAGSNVEECELAIADSNDGVLDISDQLGVNPEEGELIRKIQSMEEGHELTVNTKVLIGLTINRRALICLDAERYEGIQFVDVYETGDALITYAGQRFNSEDGDTPVDSENSVYAIEDASVKEMILGVKASDVKPFQRVSRSEAFHFDSRGDCVEHIDFEGYRHSSSIGVASTRGSVSQVNITDDENIFDTNLPHATLVEISKWLLINSSSIAEVPSFGLTASVVQSGEMGTPIVGAKVYVYINDGFIEQGVTDSNGNVIFEDILFQPNSTYALFVEASGYHSDFFDLGFRTKDTPNAQVQSFGTLELQSALVATGDLRVAVIGNDELSAVEGAEVVLKRNTVTYSGVTSSSGNLLFPGLIAGQYQVLITKNGFSDSTSFVSVSANTERRHEVVIVKRGIIASSLLNDTGVAFGGNYPDGNEQTCTNNIPSGQSGAELSPVMQDCDAGLDFSQNEDSDGRAGFSFTKLDANGNDLSSDASNWSCVRDNVTKAVWEVKTNDEGVHDRDNRYRWGGITSQSSNFGDHYSDWDVLVNNANNNQLCGLTGWRVPSIVELESIVDYGVPTPTIDTRYFPNTKVDNSYYSSTPIADNIENARIINFFENAGNSSSLRIGARYVRLINTGGR